MDLKIKHQFPSRLFNSVLNQMYSNVSINSILSFLLTISQKSKTMILYGKLILKDFTIKLWKEVKLLSSNLDICIMENIFKMVLMLYLTTRENCLPIEVCIKVASKMGKLMARVHIQIIYCIQEVVGCG